MKLGLSLRKPAKFFVACSALLISGCLEAHLETEDLDEVSEILSKISGCYYKNELHVFSIDERGLLNAGDVEFGTASSHGVGKDWYHFTIEKEPLLSLDGTKLVTGRKMSFFVRYRHEGDQTVVEMQGEDGRLHRFRKDAC